jgi:energy-converting hydrogenase B subunit H
MVTVVIFDFRAYDTLGESIILLTAGLVVLLIFGRGLLGDKQ